MQDDLWREFDVYRGRLVHGALVSLRPGRCEQANNELHGFSRRTSTTR